MAIVINGSGTVTGLAVGGLPDGTVDAGTVAADVATQAEIDAKLNLAGGTMTNNLTLADNVKLNVGTSADLKIYHDASNSYIEDGGTGNLKLRSNKFYIDNADSSKDMAIFTDGGSCDFYHNNTRKLETTSAGITAQGRLEIQTANDSATHLVQRMGSTDGSYGYVDLELVSPNSTAAGLPRLDLQVGNSTVASFLRGGGITFNGDTAAANALNDYEEGTWTPVLGGSSESGQSYEAQNGRYTKIGRQVFCSAYLALTNEGSISSFLRIKGFPFGVDPTNIGAVAFAYTSNWSLSSGHWIEGWVYSDNLIYLYESNGSGGATQLSSDHCTNNSKFAMTFSFQTDD